MDPRRRTRAGFAARRQLAAVVLFGVLLVAAVRATLSARLERADFTYVNGGEVTSLDPATVTGTPEGKMIYSIFEGLVIKHPRTLEPIPGMAERWEISDDGLTYTFHLRKGAVWTNLDDTFQEEVTAHDFVYTYQRFLHPETAAAYAYAMWYVEGARAYTTVLDEAGQPLHDFDETVGVRALDRYTLEMVLASPTSYFLHLLTFYPLFPVNRTNLESARERWPDDWRIQWLKPENIITNGPYKVLERRVNDRIRLVKNEHYWDADNVAFETVDALATENYFTMLNLYLTGEVDWIDRLATNAVPQLISTDAFNPEPYLSTYFYRVNTTRPPTDDARVRRALALAIPRREICDKIMKAGQLPTWSLVPPMEGYEGAEMRHAPFVEEGSSGEGDDYETAFAADCAEAQRLLAEAGYGPDNPFPTIEIHYNTSEAHRDIAEVIGSVWKRVLGIKVKLLNQEWKVYLDTQKQLTYQVSRAGWIGDYPDPNTYVDLFVTGGENNKTGWGNARYDELVRAAAVELDPEARLGILYEAEQLLLEELPILPIYSYVDQNVVAPRLGGFYPNLQDTHMPKFWYWMDDEELDAKRAAYADELTLSDPHGPPQGLYSAAQQRERAARGAGTR